GAIAVALAHSLPLATVTALDISEAALVVARRNAEANGVADRVRFLQSGLLSAVTSGRVDAVGADPPYVAAAERELLESQVRDFEPAVALFGGPSGFEVYERLIPQAHAALEPGGWLLMEMGLGQRDALKRLLFGWDDVSFVDDLQRIPRVACARRG